MRDVTAASSDFAFLAVEWPEVAGAASRAETLAQADVRAACFTPGAPSNSR